MYLIPFLGCLDVSLLMQWLQSAGVGVHLLELTKQDIRPDLVAIRNKGISRFIVDVGSDLIVPFFEQVRTTVIILSAICLC